MYGQSCETIKRERDDLRYEVENLRADQERQREEEEERRERSRRELQAQISERLECVDNWPEAFRLGIPLIVREAGLEAAHNHKYADDPEWKQDHFFKEWLAQVHRARDIYNEVMVEVEKEITAIRAKGLAAVADRLVAEYGVNPTAQAFRDNRPDFLTYW